MKNCKINGGEITLTNNKYRIEAGRTPNRGNWVSVSCNGITITAIDDSIKPISQCELKEVCEQALDKIRYEQTLQEWSKVFEKSDADELARLSLIDDGIGNCSAEEAKTAIQKANKEYNLNNEEIIEIVDKFNMIDGEKQNK